MQEVLAPPSDYNLANSIENNVVRSTPFTRRYIRIPILIHGCDVADMKEKITKKLSKMPNHGEVRDVLSHTTKNYSKISLYIDVMHLNSIIFLVGLSKHNRLI